MGGQRLLIAILRRLLATTTALLTLTALAACPPAQAAGRTGTAGTSLTLDGSPWWPIGMNAYQLGTDWNVNAGCGAQVNLDDYFSRLPPHTVTRFDVYSSMALDKNTGALNFSALDAVFDAAARHGQLLVGVLSGHDGDCRGDATKVYSWYAGGWRDQVSPGSPMSFGSWLDTAVARWSGSPALAGWTAVGEPEPSTCGSADCAWTDRGCPADAAQVLRTFFDDTGARIRAADPDAVIWSGLAGGGQCGSAGADYADVAASPGIDVLEYHDYSPGTDLSDGLHERIEQAHGAGKPLVVAEIGLPSGSCLLTRDKRRDQLAQAISAARADGAAGALFWSFVPDPRPDQCTLDVGPDDPLFGLLTG